MTKCDATCCDMGNVSLHLNEEELTRIYGKEIFLQDFKKLGIKTLNAKKKLFSIESKCLCRQFDEKTHKCLIYERRPSSCRDFPFIVEKDALVIKSGCSLSKRDPEYRKLVEITSLYKKVIIQKG